MSGVKISELPAASVASGTDQIEVNQTGTSRRVTVEQLLDGVATTEFVEEAIAAIPPTGSLLSGFWTSNTAAFVPPPATGRVRLSVVWPPAVSASIHLYIHNTDADSLVYTWSVGPNVGDLIVLRSISGARLDATVTAKSSSTYLDITVTVLAASGTLANNSRCQIAAIQFVSNYLPLAGGTLTGGLIGTTANFSGFVASQVGQFSGPDDALVLRVAGASKGIRFICAATGSAIEGVDSTWAGSYQPLNLGGSVVNVTVPLTGTTATFSGAVTALSATAVGAGANTQAFVKASSTANLGIYYGSGDPTFSAAKGSLYSKTDATTTTTRLWVNTNGSTTWANFTSSA